MALFCPRDGDLLFFATEQFCGGNILVKMPVPHGQEGFASYGLRQYE
jgi:hypothetical protein